MKYKIIKAIDIAGLQFLDPIVRLIYREDPALQIKRIAMFLIMPGAVFLFFVWAWNYYAPKHKTKSGEVPTPSVVLDAASGIWSFHQRENIKSSDYGLTGKEREIALAETESRLLEIEHQEREIAREIDAASKEYALKREQLQAPYKEKLEQARNSRKESEAARKAKLEFLSQKAEASQLLEDKNAYLAALRSEQLEKDGESNLEKSLRADLEAAADFTYEPLAQARNLQKRIAEEKQFLQKRIDYLTKSNRGLKMETYSQTLDSYLESFQASNTQNVASLGGKILREEERLGRLSESEYAQPWTFPRQIKRSLICVFMGFALASAISIPIGILCGLSKTFMAAMTPFIALFKPVSPIVWLPIALIVVGGFIPDPDNHWFISTLQALPVIGSYDPNPAMIASAITVALCSLWPTLVNTAFGVASIDKDHLNVARVLRLGFWDRLFKIVIPSALPLTFAGLRISLGVGWMVLIAAELLSSSEGIGKFVWDMFNNGSSESFAQMFVVVFVVGLIGMILDRGMIVLQRLFSFDEAPSSI